jgi:photosystem II stability/assembly factor-like uncharacterized protein
MPFASAFLVATATDVLALRPGGGAFVAGKGLGAARPTCLAADPLVPGRAWCGTTDSGVYRSEDGGQTWVPSGLAGTHVTAIAASPVRAGTLWAGTEPSALLQSTDGGMKWTAMPGLNALPSSSEWAFPPRPETHHVRWIACHPDREGHLWIAVEAGALVTTPDGGLSWHDRVPGGPRDTHELAVHRERPEHLRVAAGDGYFESDDAGATWTSPDAGLDVGYLRSVAVAPDDPDVVLVSASSRARSAYASGHSDGRLYRREGRGPWERVVDGWPDPPETIAPLLVAGGSGRAFVAADERGLHGSDDGGRSWRLLAPFPSTPPHLRGLVRIPGIEEIDSRIP